MLGTAGHWGSGLVWDGDALAMAPVPSPTSSAASTDLVEWLGMEISMGMAKTIDKSC